MILIERYRCLLVSSDGMGAKKKAQTFSAAFPSVRKMARPIIETIRLSSYKISYGNDRLRKEWKKVLFYKKYFGNVVGETLVPMKAIAAKAR